MARIPVFYSFHFKPDVMRVHQVRNIGAIEQNEPVSKNDWLQIQTRGVTAIKAWIDENMKYKRCVIVLIGSNTAGRPWVKYEIEKAWADGRGLLGIHIHNLKCPNSGTCAKGRNPFEVAYDKEGKSLASQVNCYDPKFSRTHAEIRENLASWVDRAIKDRHRPKSGFGFF